MIGTSQGGGVVIYIKDTLPHHKRDDVYDTNLEIVGVAAVAVQQGDWGTCPSPISHRDKFSNYPNSMRKC